MVKRAFETVKGLLVARRSIVQLWKRLVMVKSVVLYGCELGQSKRKKKATWIVLKYSCEEECLKWNGLLGWEIKKYWWEEEKKLVKSDKKKKNSLYSTALKL